MEVGQQSVTLMRRGNDEEKYIRNKEKHHDRIINPDNRMVIDEVAPTLEVFDEVTGKNSSFVEIRPIFNPPLAELFR